jgi:PiT family inorganic phosphate transporter
VLIPALISPIVAGLAAWVAVKLIFQIVKKLEQGEVERGFRHGQTVTALLVALSHGTNDAQKTMGVITLTLIAAGIQPTGTGPQLWVVVICGFAIALGTYSGGWRVIRTLGKGLTEITTPQGFAAEVSSATTILVSSHLGFALSTTQVCSGSIIGSGLGKKGAEVNWSVAGRMIIAWLVTFPAAGIVGACACALAKTGFWGTIAVAAIAAVLALIIVRLSHRNPINAANVNQAAPSKPLPAAAAA